MNNFFRQFTAGILGLFLMTSHAWSQALVDYNQAIKSLAATGNTANRVGVDTRALKRSIKAKIAKEGYGNAKDQSTILASLKRLPQLIVQIQFNTDSALIRPKSWVTVGKIADALHHPLLLEDRFLIVGHTDARGKRDYNLSLSERRALSVASMLIDVYRINPARLVVLGLGEEQLRNMKKPDGLINRRVELFNLGPA